MAARDPSAPAAKQTDTLMTALTFALGLVFLLLAAHPFVTYPLSLALLRRLRPVPLRAAAGPPPRFTFSICVCAYNEAAVIRAKVANLLALRERTPDLEILVYDDASADGTAAILHEYGDRLTLVASPQRTGKTVGMNRLVALSRGEIVVFSDADVMVAPDALDNLGRYFADPEVGCVCGHLRPVNREQSVTAANGADYRRLGEVIKQLESDTGSVLGADGALFAVRRPLHRPVPEDLIDDMYVSLGVLLDGHRVVHAPDVLAFENAATGTGDEFRRKVRIACQAFNVHRRLWPRLRRLDPLHLYKYLSHKLLRWLTIFNLALADVFFIVAVATLTSWFVVLGAVALAVIAVGLSRALRIPPFPRVLDGLLALIGTGVGVLYAMRGKEFRTWTPPATVRGTK